MLSTLRPWHIIILVAVLILLFGAKRLPGAARSLGRSLRIIKSETRGLVDEPEPDDLDDKATAQHGRKPLDGEQQSAGNAQQNAGNVWSGDVQDPPERAQR